MRSLTLAASRANSSRRADPAAPLSRDRSAHSRRRLETLTVVRFGTRRFRHYISVMSSGETPEEWDARLRDRSQELQQQYDSAAEQGDSDGMKGVEDERDKVAQEYDDLARLLDDIAAERDLLALQRDIAASQRDRARRQESDDVDPGWSDRFLSGTDRDRAAVDRAAAFEDRKRAGRDRAAAASARAASAQDRADAARSQRQSSEVIAQLGDALASRTVIGQATGILIERFKITPDEAFQLLIQASQRRNIKLREVARIVVETGQAPGDI